MPTEDVNAHAWTVYGQRHPLTAWRPDLPIDHTPAHFTPSTSFTPFAHGTAAGGRT
ncbi:hypothetical protein [Streptomyces formicae]|uniref:Uncharacterized protein n=1 Tax=Streptomyces formicae TaxID=1616117 RepID=A0A291QLN5_9ACTN|nr:hypothetical protein [Streptomyces formicae]ATL32373.1 hypothetical protein KY5_7355c [Streptomyces formicae]